MDQAAHAQALRDLKAQNEKARAENAKKLKALQDAIDNLGQTSPEVDAAMADLKASIQAEDDENPDEPSQNFVGGGVKPGDTVTSTGTPVPGAKTSSDS